MEPNYEYAYIMGSDAAVTGKSAADCPFEYGTPQGEQWMLGYQEHGGQD